MELHLHLTIWVEISIAISYWQVSLRFQGIYLSSSAQTSTYIFVTPQHQVKSFRFVASKHQRYIENPAEDLRWSFFAKIVNFF